MRSHKKAIKLYATCQKQLSKETNRLVRITILRWYVERIKEMIYQ